MRSGWSIPRQFTLLGTLGVLFTLIALGIGLRTSYDIALQARKAELQTLTESLVNTTEGFVTLANEGKMTVAQAKQEALTAIGGARYDGGNYFFTFDDNGTVLYHPNNTYLGRNFSDHRDAYGSPDAEPLIVAAEAGHPIFLNYYQTKPGSTVPEPKISYAAAVPEWGWVIGTGLYVDDLQSALIGRLIGLSEIFLPLFVAFLGLIYFMRRSVSSVLSSLTACMDQIAGAQLEFRHSGP